MVVTASTLSVVAYGSSISMLGYESQLVRKLWEMLEKPEMKISIQTLTAFVANIFICVSLCGVILSESAKLAPHSITKSAIRRYTYYTICRNFLEALVELLAFTFYIGWIHDNSYYWTIFHIPSSKVYVNTVLAMFNARQSLMDHGQEASESFIDSQESILFATIVTFTAEEIG
ncbi:hypothetical protein FOMPIDRAFT_1021584 [Fomitopsis schrenkii]|uniref:DUF6534 domain-containing protein n=1 Tax=Fomitopsis schrenkii TaxID=2126942 RepID=S8EQT3_FOMSC|nr:hypothetical protein FOMPIDRAFT_1021584 [Fomitopsis schrenkii]